LPSKGRADTEAVLAVLVVIALAAAAIIAYGPSLGQSGPAGISTSRVSSGRLTITEMHGDVASSNNPQALYSNSSTFSGQTKMNGSAGETFSVEFDIVYQACACGPEVTGVEALTPGFTVLTTTPATPIRFTGSGGDFYQVGFTVELKAPQAAYTGPLILLAHIG